MSKKRINRKSIRKALRLTALAAALGASLGVNVSAAVAADQTARFQKVSPSPTASFQDKDVPDPASSVQIKFNRALPASRIQKVTPGQARQDYFLIRMKPTYISSYQTGGSAGDAIPSESPSEVGAHTGGANILLGDGSVRFITETIEPLMSLDQVESR